jgi:hypothetical protein
MTSIENTDKKKYFIFRNDRKLTGDELTFEEATQELERWRKILKKWPDGTHVRMVEVTPKY